MTTTTATIRLHFGSTRISDALASRLRSAGWRWDRLCQSWTRPVPSLPAVGDEDALAALGARYRGAQTWGVVGAGMPVLLRTGDLFVALAPVVETVTADRDDAEALALGLITREQARHGL